GHEDNERGAGLDVLEAELRHIVLVYELAHRDLVEVAVLAADVPQAVQMGADVALAQPRVLHVGELVLAERRARTQRRRREDRLRGAGAEARPARHERVRHRDYLPFPYL